MCVSIHPVLWRQCYFIEVATVIAAFAWLDEHGWLLEVITIWADEGHGYCACAAWWAASSICAHTTEVGSVEADAHTLSVGQVDGLWGFLGWGALFPSLWMDNRNRMSFICWITVKVVAHSWLASVEKKITKTNHVIAFIIKNLISFTFICHFLLYNSRFKRLCAQIH